MRTILLFVFLFFTVAMAGQTEQKQFSFDAVYVAFQPVDFGVGIRADYHLGIVGVYNSITYGDWGMYRRFDVRHHVKYTMGVKVPLKDYNNSKYGFTVGINYHKLGSVMVNKEEWNPALFNPWSFEIGFTVYCWNHFAVGIRTDILRKEPCADFGYSF